MEQQDTSFAKLYGKPFPKTDGEKSGLMEWHERAYNLPFSRFSVEDLARACRQNLFPDYIVPYALEILREHPLAGELYEGELFNALTVLPIDFWKQNSPCAIDLLNIFKMWENFLSENLDAEEEDFGRLQRFVHTIAKL